MEYQFASRFTMHQKTSKRCLQPKYPFPKIYQKVPDKLLPENQMRERVTPVNSQIPTDTMKFNATLSAKPPFHNPQIKTLSITNLIREEVQNILHELNLTNQFLRKGEVDYIIEKCVKDKLAASQVDDLNSINAESDSYAKPDIEVTVQMLNDNDKSKLIVENFQMLEQRITKLEEKIEMVKTLNQCHDNNLNTISTMADLPLPMENQEPSYKDVAIATEPVTDDDKDINRVTDSNNDTDTHTDKDTDTDKEDQVETVAKNTDDCNKDVNLENSESYRQQVQKMQIENEILKKFEDSTLDLSTEFNYYDEFYYLTRQRDRNQLNKNRTMGPFQMSKQPQINPFAKPISVFKPHGGLLKGQKARFIS